MAGTGDFSSGSRAVERERTHCRDVYPWGVGRRFLQVLEKVRNHEPVREAGPLSSEGLWPITEPALSIAIGPPRSGR